jgi:hypothetical protein
VSIYHWLLRLFTRRRFCEDCFHYKQSKDGIGPALCTHDHSGEDNTEHLVRRDVPRNVKPYACSLMRRGACGRAGKLWRPK